MRKIIISLTSIVLMNLFSACAPEGANNKSTGSDRVDELVINDLTANKWCQKNQTTGATEYHWLFVRDKRVFTTNASDQASQAFAWTITNDNVLSVMSAPNGPVLFTKKVSYSYDINIHKRTMRWIDTQTQQNCDNQGVCHQVPQSDITSFTECE